MPLHPDADPLAVSTTVVTLRPDGLVLDFEKEPGTCLDLAELFSGPPAYDTLRLRYGLEMHHHLGSTEAPNAAASRFAEHCGYEPIDIRGTVWFTGASAETDSAPGMDDAMYLELFETLSAVSDTHGLRLRSQYRPHETVFVKPTDYAPGTPSGSASRTVSCAWPTARATPSPPSSSPVPGTSNATTASRWAPLPLRTRRVPTRLRPATGSAPATNCCPPPTDPPGCPPGTDPGGSPIRGDSHAHHG
ncbi:hypothetical protein SANT12839_102450 [Streptomyces antimycoticus]|uniref:Uncharacterized protein n=1 Tax=Streptomyces antimycoticus TaxID=68175 RepID=A0A4D4KU40_9ACTN|nr:hypothetical protein SANT12839_102450 [Streptomyces antimycoticus]